MKHLSPNKILFFSLLIVILAIAMIEFVFENTVEPFEGGAKLAEITVNLCLSFIAAYLFYLITFVIPKYIERKQIEEHAAHLINKVLFHILFIMQDATNFNISQKDLKLKPLTETDFKDAMKNVFMDNELKRFRTGKDGHNQNVGEAVINHIEGLKNTIDELFRYSPYIETSLISSISEAIRNNMNESWINRYHMIPSHVGNETFVAVRTDITGYAKHLYEYNRIYKTLKNILLTKYSSTAASLKYAENILNLKES